MHVMAKAPARRTSPAANRARSTHNPEVCRRTSAREVPQAGVIETFFPGAARGAWQAKVYSVGISASVYLSIYLAIYMYMVYIVMYIHISSTLYDSFPSMNM